MVDCQPLGRGFSGWTGDCSGCACFVEVNGSFIDSRSCWVCCHSRNICTARRKGGTLRTRSESMGQPWECISSSSHWTASASSFNTAVLNKIAQPPLGLSLGTPVSLADRFSAVPLGCGGKPSENDNLAQSVWTRHLASPIRFQLEPIPGAGGGPKYYFD